MAATHQHRCTVAHAPPSAPALPGCTALSCPQTRTVQQPLPQVRPATVAFTIPAASKEPKAAAYGPGPGEYAPPAPKSGPAFSMAPRCPHATTADDHPGPGEYEAEVLAHAPAFTMAPRRVEPRGARRGTAVGPAEYDLPSSFPAGPAFSVPKTAFQDGSAAEHNPGTPHSPHHGILFSALWAQRVLNDPGARESTMAGALHEPTAHVVLAPRGSSASVGQLGLYGRSMRFKNQRRAAVAVSYEG